MKTIKKSVYYCDHCKKKGLSRFHLNKHEIGCTANPDRKCGLCDNELNIRQVVEDFTKLFEIVANEGGCEAMVWKTEAPITLETIRELTKGCPNCMLAILRQTHLNWDICGLEKFDYKKEFAEFPRRPQAAYEDCF